MHYFEKWTTRIYKTRIYKKKTSFFCVFLYFPSFMHLLWNQIKMSLLEMLWDSAALTTTFILRSLIHFSETRGRDSRTISSVYVTMWTINFCCIWKKAHWGVYHPKNSLHYGHLPPPCHSFNGQPFTAQLLSSPSLE